MRKPVFTLLLLLAITTITAQDFSYYLPANVSYDPAIPTPRSIINHEVGEWHVTHDRLVNYMYAVDRASDRVSLQVNGYTYEGRPQVALIITSPANHRQLEEIRQQHIKLSDPKQSSQMNIATMPSVVWIGSSIHGNESSGANAALLAAYYLAAAQGSQVDDLLNNTIILLDPAFNPDGLNKFASWVNSNKSKTPVTDAQSRELNEPWPGSRFNHYWFDLNRDWLPVQHIESRNRLKFFHQWKPNILTDHHEMGSNATFFFQPGVPSRVNPNTPVQNQELTGAIGNFHARYLDSIGSLYFTKEGYDDFYYGKGSTYPDINGSIGILFEQASSRGHAQQTDNGLLTFPFTIRNQFVTMLSTLEAARVLRKDLLDYQKNFYQQSMKEAASYLANAFVFGDAMDKGRTRRFLEILVQHGLRVYNLKQNLTVEGKSFAPGSAYLLPTAQPQFRLIKTMFEKTFEYKDSLFYDVTSWTLPLAFNMPFATVADNPSAYTGDAVNELAKTTFRSAASPSASAYAFSWQEYDAPKLLNTLLQKGVKARVAHKPLEVQTTQGKQKLSYGSIVIAAQQQGITADSLQRILTTEVTGVPVFSISSGLAASGSDLGSSNLQPVQEPRVMMFAGSGVNPLDAGEIWHLLDQRFNMPVSLVEPERFNTIDVARYNVIIMTSGNYPSLDKAAQEKLKAWVRLGGTLIATEDATRFLSTNDFTKVIFKTNNEKPDTTLSLPYHLRQDHIRAKDITGSIFEATMDLTNPLCFGYANPSISVFKANNLFMDRNNNPYASPVKFTANPLQSGYMHASNKDKLKDGAVINIDQLGKGNIISMAENLNFRAFWLGTSKIFMNAIFFGNQIRL